MPFGKSQGFQNQTSPEALPDLVSSPHTDSANFTAPGAIGGFHWPWRSTTRRRTWTHRVDHPPDLSPCDNFPGPFCPAPSQKPSVTRELCIVSNVTRPSISSFQVALPCRSLPFVLTFALLLINNRFVPRSVYSPSQQKSRGAGDQSPANRHPRQHDYNQVGKQHRHLPRHPLWCHPRGREESRRQALSRSGARQKSQIRETLSQKSALCCCSQGLPPQSSPSGDQEAVCRNKGCLSEQAPSLPGQ